MFNFVDVRYILMGVINIVKLVEAPWEEGMRWDVFTVVSNPGWLKVCFIFVASLFFGFISIRFSLVSPIISVRSQKLSPLLVVGFFGALLLPQLLFWYVYLIICLSSTAYASHMFTEVAQAVQAYFLRIPDFTISLTTTTTTTTTHANPDLEMGQAASTTHANPDHL